MNISEQLRHWAKQMTPSGLGGHGHNLHYSKAPMLEAAADEIERLRNGFREIMKATVEGRVCDDVAWFDTITTLYDFCDLFLPSPTHERGADVETKT